MEGGVHLLTNKTLTGVVLILGTYCIGSLKTSPNLSL